MPIVKIIEWIIFGENNDSISGTPRPLIMLLLISLLIGIIGWIQVKIWLHTGILTYIDLTK